MCANPKYCHICELPIPDNIVSPTHSLFGTVDHVIPKALGGPNSHDNRKPAHYMCNRWKSSRILTAHELSEQSFRVWHVLCQHAHLFTNRFLSDARSRFKPTAGKSKLIHPIQRWEDDGGYCQDE